MTARMQRALCLLLVALSAVVLSHAAPIEYRIEAYSFRGFAGQSREVNAKLVSTYDFINNIPCNVSSGAPKFCWGVPNWPCNATLLPGSVGQLSGGNQTGSQLINLPTINGTYSGTVTFLVRSDDVGWSNISVSTSGLPSDSSGGINGSTAALIVDNQWMQYYNISIDPAVGSGTVNSVVGRGYQVTATLLTGGFGTQNLTASEGKTVTFWRADNVEGVSSPAVQFATAVTNANGRATVTVPSLPEPGSSTVVARFTESAYRFEAEAALIQWLPADNTTITGPEVNITTPDTDIPPGQGVEVTVVSVDGDGNPVPNTTVTVDVNGTATPEQIPRSDRQQAPRARVLRTYSFQSDQNAEVTLRIISGSAGTSVITASYVINGSVFSTSFPLTWTDPPTLISLSPRKQVLPYGHVAKLIATVTDTAGAPLSNVPVNYGLQKLAELSHPYDLTIKDKALQVAIQAADDTNCSGWPKSDANGLAVIWVPSPKRPGDYMLGVGTRCQKNALGISVVSDYAFVKWVDEEDRHYSIEKGNDADDEWEHKSYSHGGHRGVEEGDDDWDMRYNHGGQHEEEEHYDHDWEHRQYRHGVQGEKEEDYDDEWEHRRSTHGFHPEERY